MAVLEPPVVLLQSAQTVGRVVAPVALLKSALKPVAVLLSLLFASAPTDGRVFVRTLFSAGPSPCFVARCITPSAALPVAVLRLPVVLLRARFHQWRCFVHRWC